MARPVPGRVLNLELRPGISCPGEKIRHRGCALGTSLAHPRRGPFTIETYDVNC